MWWSMVVQMRGQSMQEACAHPEQLLCSYDGGIYGDRQAKKMAKKVGRDYIFKGANVGQPRLVKTPMEPFGAEELADVERALAKGLVPPGMTLEAAEQLREAMDEDDDGDEEELDDLSPEAAAAARAHGIDFDEVAIRFEREVVMPFREDVGEGEILSLHKDDILRLCRISIVNEAVLHDDTLDRASSAVVTAKETGDPATIDAAFAHYDRKLDETVSDNGLGPLVEALRDTFFTDPHADDE
jgi:hypothetical protein